MSKSPKRRVVRVSTCSEEIAHILTPWPGDGEEVPSRVEEALQHLAAAIDKLKDAVES
jgi:hypothetical protein